MARSNSVRARMQPPPSRARTRRCTRTSAAKPKSLRDNIRKQFVLDAGNLIFQLQFTLLQTGQLNLIVRTGCDERGNRRIEIAMLLRQLRELGAENRMFLVLVHRGLRLPLVRSSPQRLASGQSYPKRSSARAAIWSTMSESVFG